MNREIKFRAWVKNLGSGEMVKVITLHFNHDGECIGGDFFDGEIEFGDDLKNIILMQFTGLKDKNGKEIYEGDILKMYRHDDITHKHEAGTVFRNGERVVDIREVKFQIGTFYTQNEFDIKVAFMHMARPGESFEIIGNIYSNPELLK